MSRFEGLAARIGQELVDLDQVVRRSQSLEAKAQRTGDVDFLDGVALNLHGFYAGLEHVFETIAREFDESMPSGPDWHRDLLLQMSAPFGTRRSAVIQLATRHCLDEYRAFRHVVRNVYTFNLRPSRVHELVAGLADCLVAVNEDLARFGEFLASVDESAN